MAQNKKIETMQNDIDKMRKIIFDTIGKDCDFKYQDFINFIEKRYKTKVYNSLEQLNIAEGYTNDDVVNEIADITDGLITENYFVCNVTNRDYLKKPDKFGTIIAFDYDKNDEVREIFISNSNLKDTYLGLFLKNGEQRILKANKEYYQ